MSGYVFISYAREDKAYVKALEAEFSARGIECWWDKRLEPGEYFQRVIRIMVGDCAALIVVASENVEKSAWVSREVASATERGKPVLPLRVDETIPLVIAPIGYEDVRTYRIPPDDFFHKISELCLRPDAKPVPRVGREDEPLPPAGTTPMTWLPFEIGGTPHTFQIIDGIVWSYTQHRNGSPPRQRTWGHLGAGVSRIAATQDGSHVVLQCPTALMVAEVNEGGGLNQVVQYPLADGWRLVATRRPPHVREPGTALQVVVSSDRAARIVSFDHRWHEVRAKLRELPQALYAGAATDDGFVVIGLDSAMARLTPEGERLAAFGNGWCDVDVASTGAGSYAAGLRRAGQATMLRTVASVADLDGAANETDGDVRAVRLIRQRGQYNGAPDPQLVAGDGRPLKPFRGLPS